MTDKEISDLWIIPLGIWLALLYLLSVLLSARIEYLINGSVGYTISQFNNIGFFIGFITGDVFFSIAFVYIFVFFYEKRYIKKGVIHG